MAGPLTFDASGQLLLGSAAFAQEEPPEGGTGGGGGTTPPDVTPTPVSQPAASAPEREAPGTQASAPAATPATPAAPPPQAVPVEVQSAVDFAAAFRCPSGCGKKTVRADGTITIDIDAEAEAYGLIGGTFRVEITDNVFRQIYIGYDGVPTEQRRVSFESAGAARTFAQSEALRDPSYWE